MRNSSIEFKNPPRNWRDYIPYGAEDFSHVDVYCSGYLHDVSVVLVLSPVIDGEEPTGWDTIDARIEEEYKHMADCWEMANRDYAYSFKKII